MIKKIKLIKDSYIASLTNKDITNSNMDFNGYKLYVNGKAINWQIIDCFLFVVFV